MNFTDTLTATTFCNVAVTLTQDITGNFHMVCSPDPVTVTKADTVISYQLVSAPSGVEFWGAKVGPATPPQTPSVRQFSSPQITANGLMMTFVDLDSGSTDTTFEVTLTFVKADGTQFDMDPQVINRPT